LRFAKRKCTGTTEFLDIYLVFDDGVGKIASQEQDYDKAD
jgi:hypothetical protein